MSRYIAIYAVFFIVWSVLLTGVNYVVDPIQFYGKHENPIFVKNQRYQIPGLIKNYEFNTAFIGTSLSENFSAEYFDKVSGKDSINLSISGSSFGEQRKAVSAALDSGKIKHIIWEFNYKSFSGENPNLVTSGQFPDHLYVDTHLTNIKYLYSLDTLWMTVKNISGIGERNLDQLNSWAEAKKHQFGGERALQHFCQRREDPPPVISEFHSQLVDSALNEIIGSNTDVTFSIFVPPMSYLNFMLTGELDRSIEFRKYVHELAKRHENIELYDFLFDYRIIGDYRNYKDIEHYSLDVSNEMLERIGSGAGSSNQHDSDRQVDSFRLYIEQKAGESESCSKFGAHDNSIST